MSEKQYIGGVESQQTPKGTVALLQLPGAQSYALQPFQGDASGNLKVVVTGAGAGGTSSVDESAFAAGVSLGTPIMAEDPSTGELLIAQMVPGTRTLQVGGSLTVSPASSSTASAPSQTTVGTSSAQALPANSARKGFILQNQGTTVIKIVLGAGPATQGNYTVALPMCGQNNDGSSSPWYGPNGLLWLGAIQWISSAAGGLAEVVELT